MSRPGRALLFDVGASAPVPLVDRLRDEGFPPAGLVLSHRHPAALGDAVGTIAARYGVPLLLHPNDARHRQAAATGLRFEDPMGHPLLEAFGVEALHFPGHTDGMVTLYGAADGALLAADGAVGPSAPQTQAGEEFLIRPPS